MSGRKTLPTVGVVLLAAALLAGAAEVQAARERLYPVANTDDESLYLTSGPLAERLTLSFHPLAADIYWIRAIQYFGGTKQSLRFDPLDPPAPPMIAADTGAYKLLYPLLDLTTTLDPRFNIAYRFGAIFLAEPYPGGPGRPDLAVKLLEKGLRERPDKWEYMQDIGFVYYWWVHDYETAAGWFEKAGNVPGAPWWLKSLAASTLAQGGDRQSSRAMWESIRQSAEIDWLRQAAERALMQLRALDEIETLQEIVDKYTAREGTPPADWTTLVRARVIRGYPVDPTRAPYVIDAHGRVRLSTSSRLFPLPEEPTRLNGGRSS